MDGNKRDNQEQAEADVAVAKEELLKLARIEFARQGGRASMASRTAKERQDMARKGAKARWDREGRDQHA
jgi:hypothetical protein